MSDSDLGSANLNWVSLRGAKISRANLRDTKMLMAEYTKTT
ncbi:pentapeptide repeat-containing protein [Nostoc sp.]